MDLMMCIANKARPADGPDPCEGCIVTCNECRIYSRGECGMTGIPMHPDDFCSKAVKAE